MDVTCVVKDIEDAIQLLVKTDCETNLKVINRLEDAAYRLWVESNTAFLDESMLSVYTEEEENLMWDDEFHFESNSSDYNLAKEEFGQEDDLCSSINTTISPRDQTLCSVESNILSAEKDAIDMDKEHPNAVRIEHFIANKKKHQKLMDSCSQIHLTSEEVNNAEEPYNDSVKVDEKEQLCAKVKLSRINNMFPRPFQMPISFVYKHSTNALSYFGYNICKINYIL